MLPTSWLVTHEDSDPQRVENLAQRLRKEGRLLATRNEFNLITPFHPNLGPSKLYGFR
jgi:hypothetical protein